ncbi:hypothetical protein SMC26_31145 [Actinomadura fulvescens]|uniref:Cellulase (Glycosyl hydrolase family 5) n=1 Tax=Actinomadura fulvescens TaxID=46160 RepID=A0ABN3PE40_9ACTN
MACVNDGPGRRQFLKIGTAAAAVSVLPAGVAGPALASTHGAQGAVMAYLDNVQQADFKGLGVHFSPFESDLTDAQWALVHERLAFMRPSVLRVIIGAGWYTKGFDVAGRPVFDWDSADMRKLYFMLDWAERNRAEVILGDWAPPSGEPLKLGPTDPRWTMLVGELLRHLFEERGYTCLKYYNLHNEPNLWFPDYGEFEPWKTSILNLHAELKRRGYLDRIVIIGPDSTEPDDILSTTADLLTGHSESWVVKAVESIKETIGAYDVHKYEYVYNVEGGDLEQRLWSQRQYLDNRDTAAKPFMVTEAGMDRGLDVPELGIRNPDTQKDRYSFTYGVHMADYAIQVMRAGGAGVLAWNLDDAQHTGGAYGSRNLKGWGFWNSLGGQDGYPVADRDPRPWFSTWSLLSRCFPRGSRTLRVPATGLPGVRATAARVPGDGLSIAVVNDTGRARSIRLRIPDVAAGARLAEYRYFDKDRPTDAKGYPVPSRTVDTSGLADGLTVDLPGRGVVILTSLGTGTTVRATGGTATFTDDLDDLSKTHAHSSGLVIDKSNPGYFAGDGARLKRTAHGARWVSYHRPGLTSFALTTYKVSALFGKVTAAVSQDGKTWKDVDLAASPLYKVDALQDWRGAVLTPAAPLPAGAAYLKIQLDGDLRVFSPQLAKVELNYRG